MEALEMERPMTEWNDDRLDEMNGRMKKGFAEVDKRFEQVDERFVRLEGEMKEGFARVDREMKEGFKYTDERMEAGFERINGRLDRLHHVFIVTAAGVIGTLLANGIWG
jgi:hypothetical protein